MPAAQEASGHSSLSRHDTRSTCSQGCHVILEWGNNWGQDAAWGPQIVPKVVNYMTGAARPCEWPLKTSWSSQSPSLISRGRARHTGGAFLKQQNTLPRGRSAENLWGLSSWGSSTTWLWQGDLTSGLLSKTWTDSFSYRGLSSDKKICLWWYLCVCCWRGVLVAVEMLSALGLFVAVALCLPGKEPRGVQAWAVLPTLVTSRWRS